MALNDASKSRYSKKKKKKGQTHPPAVQKLHLQEAENQQKVVFKVE